MLRNVFRSLTPISEKKSRPVRRQHHTKLMGGENLESRLALTATAHLNAGLLTVTGDSTDQIGAAAIHINESATVGKFVVTGVTGAPLTFIGVKNIAVNTGLGNDRVFLGSTTAPGDPQTNFTGNVTITGRGVGLEVDVQRNFNTSGALSVTDNANNAHVEFHANPTAALPANFSSSVGSLSVTNGGNAGTDISIGVNPNPPGGGVSGGTFSVKNNATFNLGNGANTVHTGTQLALNVAGNFNVGGNLVINGGTSTDVVEMIQTVVNGNLTANLGTNNGGLAFDAFLVLPTAPPPATIAGINVHGNLTVTDKASMEVALEASTVLGNVKIDNSTAGATEESIVVLEANLISGNLAITTGNGADEVELANVAPGNTKISTGGGADLLVIIAATFNGTVNIDMGNGADTFEIGVGGPGVATQFYKAVTVNMGAGADTVVLGGDNADEAIFFAASSFDGGTGANTINLHFAQFNGPAPVIKHF